METIYITPEQVCELMPGMTKGLLAQLRYTGQGPNYYKPTERKVLYRIDEIYAWISDSSVTTQKIN